MIDPSCELCEQEHITEWYHLDHLCWLADCAICRTPMIIFNWHREPTASEIEHMKVVSETHFPGYGWRNERLIPDHWHKHILPVALIHPAERCRDKETS